MVKTMKQMLEELMFNTLGCERFISVTKWRNGEVDVTIYDPMPNVDERTYASYQTIEYYSGKCEIYDHLEYNGGSAIDVSLLANFMWALRELPTDRTYRVAFSPRLNEIYWD